eukprot:COSAG05_NODE_540_length_8845_cov_13.872742_5_plen_65_part_00
MALLIFEGCDGTLKMQWCGLRSAAAAAAAAAAAGGSLLLCQSRVSLLYGMFHTAEEVELVQVVG